jgi:predicted HTH domain antitoxin
MGMNNISLRLDDKLTSRIEEISKLDLVDKAQIYRKAIEIGLKEISKELAIKLYYEEEISMSEGAKLCDMYIGEFMELLRDRGITQKPYTQEQKDYIYKNINALRPAFLAEKKKMIKYNLENKKANK